MDLMTQTGPIARETLVAALSNDVASVDSGITLTPIYTDWGVTIRLERQGKSLPWRVTMKQAGQCSIYKPTTSSLPKVEGNYPANRHLAMRDDLLEFIRAGWI